MKVIIITQARIGSTRLPGKVLKKINNKTLLEIHLLRASKARNVSKIIVATTTEPGSEQIVQIAESLGHGFFCGPVEDVLARFYMAALPEKPDYIVRITSDCPLIDPSLIDEVVNAAIDNDVDYASNINILTFPDGVDTEVIRFSALEKAFNEAKENADREHVTPYIRRNSTSQNGNLFRSISIESPVDYSDIRITVDTKQDFEFITHLVSELGFEKPWQEYVTYILNN